MSRLVFGVNPVKELLAARRAQVTVVYLGAKADGKVAKEIQDACRHRNIPVELRAPVELDAMAGDEARHQGVVAVAGEFVYAELEDILASADARGPLVVLDSVQDPHNLGAVIRSAHVMGARGVVIPKDRAVHVTPAVVKASAGATEHIPIAIVTNLVRAMEQMKEAGIWTYGAVIEPDACSPWEHDLAGPVAFVLGAEGHGVRRLVREHCDHAVRIPMQGAVASLNVSVAAGMLLYEAARQRAAR